MTSRKQQAQVRTRNLPMVTEQQVARFDRLLHQLRELYNELSNLSKKAPDGAVNKFKLSIINEKLSETNELLGVDFMPSRQFTVFDVDGLPTNSDVVMMLSQYLDSLEAWRSGRIHKDGYDWYWNTDDGVSIEAAGPPSRYIDKQLGTHQAE